ncbi:MAG: hypothetical protein ACM37W_01700 [Actinomycetota bacterium]
MSEATPELNNSQTYDAQQIAESVASGEQKLPQVDVAADYEASKEFSVSDVDRSGKGQQAAATATAPQFNVSSVKETQLKTEPTGNPDGFRSMAKEIRPEPADVESISDDLVQKALDKGQPA